MERTKKVSVWMAFIAAIVLAVSVLVAAAPAPTSGDEENASSDPTASPTPSETTTGEECSTWEQVESDNGNNRWMAQGVASIREASSDEEAREASFDWAEQVRQDPQLLSGAAQYFLDEDVSTEALFENKCATERAEQLYNELLLVLGESSVAPEDAPSTGYNSGVDSNGNVVTSASAGVSGDRSAVKVTLPSGKEIWVLARCGNPVVTEKPPIPEGPTDEPEKPEEEKPPPSEEPCPPGTVPHENRCVKPAQSEDDMQNGDTGVRQNPDGSDHPSSAPQGPTQDSDGNTVEEPSPAPTIRDDTPGDEGQESPSPAPHPDDVEEDGADSGGDDQGSSPEGSTSDSEGDEEASEPTNDPEEVPESEGGSSSEDPNDGTVDGP